MLVTRVWDHHPDYYSRTYRHDQWESWLRVWRPDLNPGQRYREATRIIDDNGPIPLHPIAGLVHAISAFGNAFVEASMAVKRLGDMLRR